MKKTILVFLVLCILLTQVEAEVDLNGFANDFKTLIVGVTRDVAPNLQMSALSGNIVGDATIDRFMIFFPAVGLTVSDGLGTILENGAYNWVFISIPKIIDTVVGTDAGTLDTLHAIESRIFAYPSFKIGFGFGLPKGFDVIFSGMYIPPVLTETLVKNAGDKIESLGVSINTMNIGAEVRKTIIKDSKKTPALSLGALYNYGNFNMEVAQMKLSSLIAGGFDVSGQKLDMNGSLSFNTSVHNIGLDLHVSKHLHFFTPYAKISGIYQYAVTESDVDLLATLGDPATTGSTIKIQTNPSVVISNFSSFATVGFDLNLFIFILNTNAVIDLARAELNISDLSVTGITGRGFTINTGFRWEF